MKLNKKYYVLIFVALVFIITCLLLFASKNNKYISVKKSQDGSKLPQLNIKSNDSTAINEYLENLYNQYTEDKRNKFTYTYSSKGDILSILAIIDEFNNDANTTIRKYMAFNINKKTGKYLSKEEIAGLYQTDLGQIKEKVEQHLKTYYDKEAQEEYLVKEECNFNCYLSYLRAIDVLTDQVVLVIEKKQLVAYTNFDVTFSDDADYFKTLKENYYRTVIKEL